MNVKNAINQRKAQRFVSDPQEEADWLRAVANGDRSSFRKLHERFRVILFSTIFKVLNNREDSEDILQEVFAQIWGKAHLYEASKGKPLTWANTMARNRAIDRYRSKQRRALLGERYQDHLAVIPIRVAVNTEAEVQSNETGKVLRAAVIELTPEQRESIELTYFGGLTQREVAEQIGQEVGTVKARIRRGMQSLEKRVRADLLEN
jgi:RNA polymerase sigma-70 factor (ECF subfamily)